jgi:hypothetical protein
MIYKEIQEAKSSTRRKVQHKNSTRQLSGGRSHTANTSDDN